MATFLTKSTLVLDTVYNVTEYRKVYDDSNYFYFYLIKLTNSGNTYTFYLSEGAIYDRLFSGVTTPFSIKKTNIAISDTINVETIIIVDDHDWKTLV